MYKRKILVGLSTLCISLLVACGSAEVASENSSIRNETSKDSIVEDSSIKNETSKDSIVESSTNNEEVINGSSEAENDITESIVEVPFEGMTAEELIEYVGVMGFSNAIIEEKQIVTNNDMWTLYFELGEDLNPTGKLMVESYPDIMARCKLSHTNDANFTTWLYDAVSVLRDTYDNRFCPYELAHKKVAHEHEHIENYDMGECLHIHNNMAWVYIRDGVGGAFWALTDMDGNIKYVADNVTVYEQYSVVRTDDGIKIMDENYDIVGKLDYTDEIKSYDIIGYYDGKFLVMSEHSSFSAKSKYIYTVDCFGNILSDMYDISTVEWSFFVLYDWGEGMFMGERYLFDTVRNKLYTVPCITPMHPFSNGYAACCITYRNKTSYDVREVYVLSADELRTIITDEYTPGCGFNWADTPYEYVTSNNVYTVPKFNVEFGKVSDGIYWDSSKNVYHSIKNKCDINVPVYSEQVGYYYYGTYNDGYAIIILRGADGFKYFTLIDENGVQQYEPIRFPETVKDYHNFATWNGVVFNDEAGGYWTLDGEFHSSELYDNIDENLTVRNIYRGDTTLYTEGYGVYNETNYQIVIRTWKGDEILRKVYPNEDTVYLSKEKPNYRIADIYK